MKRYINLIILSITLILSACEKFVDIDPPEDQLVTETTFENDETAISTITGLYANMMTSSFPTPQNILVNTGLYSDELTYPFSSVSTLTVYKNNLLAKDSPTNVIWTNGYKYVYAANSVLEGLEKSNGVTIGIKKQLSGEALLIRAFWHFYLCNLYGDIPYISSTNYSENAVMGRLSINNVYENIANDLNKAKELLNEKYLAGNTITETVDRLRPNKYVASALLSRVYLYMGNWALAESEASLILNNVNYSLEGINTAFKKQSKEAIWQLQMPTPATNTTYEGLFAILTAKPTGTSVLLSTDLLTVFDSKDLRRINWIGSFVDKTVTPNITYYFPFKYKTQATPFDEHSIVFRLGEVILTRAEAYARQNKLADAIKDTDRIRMRAGLTLLKDSIPGISQPALIDAIIKERQKELFCEWGHRWLDLKRTGKADLIMSIATPKKGGTWSSNWLYWPIPLNDILNNTKLVQNEGYN